MIRSVITYLKIYRIYISYKRRYLIIISNSIVDHAASTAANQKNTIEDKNVKSRRNKERNIVKLRRMKEGKIKWINARKIKWKKEIIEKKDVTKERN